MTEGRTHATKRHVCATRDVLEPGTQGARQPRTSQNIVSHPSPLTAQDVVGSIPCGSWRRQHGPLVMAYWGQGGAAKRDVRRRNQNSQNEPGMCPGINSFTFWRLTFSIADWAPGSL